MSVTTEGDSPTDIRVNPDTGKVLLDTTTGNPATTGGGVVFADIEFGLDRIMELLFEAQQSPDRIAVIDADEPNVKLSSDPPTGAVVTIDAKDVASFGSITISFSELEDLIAGMEEKQRPPKEQVRPNNGAGTIIGKLIYNTVTTLYVGEKIMIQMPTWFFPAGAGP